MTKPRRMVGKNLLLNALPSQEAAYYQSRMERYDPALKESLYEEGKPIQYVYFPLEGVISLVKTMEDGSIVEVATIGNEGMATIPAFLGAEIAPHSSLAQIPGPTLRMTAGDFREEIERGGSLVGLLHRYTQTLFTQLAQTVVCNRLHSIEQRCCRWLLQTHDRVPGDEFPLTQEFLGQMLGVRRASVNEVATKLQEAGYINYSRGSIKVLDRDGLHRWSCECYDVIREEFDRLVGSALEEAAAGPED